MPPSSSSIPGQTPSDNPLGLVGSRTRRTRTTNPVQPSHGGPRPTPSAPWIPQAASGIPPIRASKQDSPYSINPTFPVPQRYGTEPTVTRSPPSQPPSAAITYPPLPIQTPPVSSVPRPLALIKDSPDIQQRQASSAAKEKELLESLVYPEGEIPVFDKADADSRMSTRSGAVTLKCTTGSISSWKTWKMFSSSSRESWIDAHCALLDSHFVVVTKKTSSTDVDKSILHFRPIPLEYLRLEPFNKEPEVQEHRQGFFKRIGSYVHISPGPTKEQMYPFTFYHVTKMTRQQTIYTKTMVDRDLWKVALEKAIESRRKSQQDAKIYTPRIFNDGFFKVPPSPINRRARYTGRVLCAALFSFQLEEFPREAQGNYIAIGCITGVYVSKRTERTEDYSFRKILKFNEPNSILVIPEFNKFLVHRESTLSSFPLDKVIRASRAAQGDASAALKDLAASEEKLSKDGEQVFFLKAGRLLEKTADPDRTTDRIVVIYAVKNSEDEKITSHVLELKRHDGTSQAPATFLPLGPAFTIPEEPHDATCFVNKVAICTSKAIYFVEPMNASNPDPKKVPRLLKKGKNNKLKIVELMRKARVLGMVTHGRDQDFLLVYDNLGYFVDQAGRPARTNYYIEWDRQVMAFARRGQHLLLFSPGYIEVRHIDTGRLFRIVAMNKLRLLRSSLTEGQLLIGVATGDVGHDGSRTEKLVELVYHGRD